MFAPLLIKRAARWASLTVLGALLIGCASVRIVGDKRANLLPAEPVGFVIYVGNTGSQYTVPLKRQLDRELALHHIAGRTLIITGVELDEDSLIGELARQSRRLVFMSPAGGTSRDGELTQLLYDVRVVEAGGRAGTTLWRARVDAKGSSVRDRQQLLGRRLLHRLVVDRVIPTRTELDH